MIKSITIENFKSIKSSQLELGRINVFIGENGAGKSNILEAIAFAGAARAGKIDNEFLTSRGIRVTRPGFMVNAFSSKKNSDPIRIRLEDEHSGIVEYEIRHTNEPYATWSSNLKLASANAVSTTELPSSVENALSKLDPEELEQIQKLVDNIVSHAEYVKSRASDKNDTNSSLDEEIQKNYDLKSSFSINRNIYEAFFTMMHAAKGVEMHDFDSLKNFIIYSPENSALRVFEKEGQIEPLGINGEGLLKLLAIISNSDDTTTLDAIKNSLRILGWFGDFNVTKNKSSFKQSIEIQDIYFEKRRKYFDQKSANEGFLFLVFYFALFNSYLTPNIFAIDNIDALLNPKLCQSLMEDLYEASIRNNKQVLFTTHNPAILDGIDLNDPHQKLFVVSRGREGHTRVRSILKPRSVAGTPPVRLSEAFLRGSLGGLPKSF